MPRQGIPVLREQTRKWIAENPSDVVFSRTTEEPDGAGGTRRVGPTQLDKQRMRIVPQSLTNVRTRSIGGEMVQPNYLIVGDHDANVVNDDTLTIHGIAHRVVWITKDDYRTVVEVVAS